MDKIVTLLALIFAVPAFVSSAYAKDPYSSLACQLKVFTGEAPELPGKIKFPVNKDTGAAKSCETLLEFANGETALVKRSFQHHNGSIQNQLVIVSTRHDTMRPIIGQSQQSRLRYSSSSFAEGGSRGGTSLPKLTEKIDLVAPRSMGLFRIGVETFQLRFSIEQRFKRTFASTELEEKDFELLVEFDLCGRRVKHEASLYPTIAIKHGECENYTKKEKVKFFEFWKF